MLNSTMVRLTPDERRRQLLGIGLRMFVDKPVQEVSIDAVAAEAGISRGLLFHYFPTKTAYHQAVVAAAGRRFLRNARPDDGATGEVALEQVTRRFIEQIRRQVVVRAYGRLGFRNLRGVARIGCGILHLCGLFQ